MATEASEAVAAMILERQRVRTSTHAQHTTAVTELRRLFKERRDVGLKRRHARKLARNRQAEMLF